MGMDSDIVGAIVEFAGKRHRVAAIALAPGGLGFQAMLESSDGGDLHHVNLSSAIVRVVEYAPRPGQVAAIRIEAERQATSRAGERMRGLEQSLITAAEERDQLRVERDELRETIWALEERLAATRHVERMVPRGLMPADRADERDALNARGDGDGDPTRRHGG